MARGKPVVLPSRTFANQTLAGEHFASMLNRYSPGDRVSDEDAAELADEAHAFENLSRLGSLQEYCSNHLPNNRGMLTERDRRHRDRNRSERIVAAVPRHLDQPGFDLRRTDGAVRDGGGRRHTSS